MKKLSSSRTIILLIGLVYWPGVLLHELSHFLFAKVLAVPVYGFKVFPKLTPNGVEFGHVKVQRTGFLRRFFIALAPSIIGVASLVLIYFIFQNYTLTLINKAVLVYVFLCVLNMMLPSKADLRSILGK